MHQEIGPGRPCPACGAVNAPGNRFCGQCAARLDQPARARFAAPERYTPGDLAERILTSRTALEGERKHVTVLFADLKGSMELLADRDPEDARAILDPILELMIDAVHRYEGTVNQVMGDGIMALFGAPLAHEDHAVRACYAALRMQESARAYAETVRRRQGILPQIRVGLNSGEVVVRSIASDLHIDYTAVGEATHLAARVEQAASPGSVVITAATRELAEGHVEVTALGPVSVKGRASPVELFELVGGGAGRSRFRVRAARGLARFVGRSGEMDALTAAFERALAGHGGTVAVVGDAGVGKSRLLWEFTHAVAADRGLVLETASASYGKTTSYVPIIQMLRAYFQIGGRDDQRTVREKVIGKLLSLDRGLEPSLSALLALLDVPVDDHEWAAREPLERRQRTLDAVTHLLIAESRIRPVVIVCEDLHWIDRDSRAVLDHLVERVAGARVLLLLSYRPEYRPGWAASTEVVVEPLAAANARELLGALLGADASVAALEMLLVERTGGNPLFLEQSVRALVETHVLAGEPGAYRLAGPVRAVDVPASVQGVLAARIDRLAPEDKRLLQAAAVIGRDVPMTLLQAVADAPESDVRRGVARLRAAGFLDESRLFPDLEYAFRHTLTQEVAYTALLQQRRRDLHGRAVEALESLHAGRLSEHVERLAYHARSAQLWDKAIVYLREASSRAAMRSAYAESLASFEEALRVLDHLPASRATTAQAIDLRLESRIVLAPLGQYDRILRYMQEADVLAREIGDRRRRGLVLADMGARLRNVGEHQRALEASRQALAIAGELGDVDLRWEATYRLAQAQFALGDLGDAEVTFRETVRAFAGRSSSALPAFAQAWPHAWLGVLLAHLGRFEEAREHAEASMEIAGRTEHPHTQVEAHAAEGSVSLERGDLETAERVFERGLASSRGSVRDANLLSGLGCIHALRGRLEEALGLLEESVSGGASISAMGSGLAVRLSRLAEALLWAGRTAEALRHARAAVDLSIAHHERANEAIARRVLAEITVATDPSAAEKHYRESLALADEIGMRPLGAHCHAGLGGLSRRLGRSREASEHVDLALAAYREMGMRFWLERVASETHGA